MYDFLDKNPKLLLGIKRETNIVRSRKVFVVFMRYQTRDELLNGNSNLVQANRLSQGKIRLSS